MNLLTIIAALKARCPSFGTAPNRRFAGAAEFAALSEAAKLDLPAGYVIPLDDESLDQQSQNGYRQTVRDMFGVVVVVSNTTDERGQTSINSIDALRTELFKALLGWQPTADYHAIEYRGGSLLHVDRARLYYQFEFSAAFEIGEEDTYQAIFNTALPAFEELGIQGDAIDPYDPNKVTIGPDGRIEVAADIELPQ